MLANSAGVIEVWYVPRSSSGRWKTSKGNKPKCHIHTLKHARTHTHIPHTHKRAHTHTRHIHTNTYTHAHTQTHVNISTFAYGYHQTSNYNKNIPMLLCVLASPSSMLRMKEAYAGANSHSLTNPCHNKFLWVCVHTTQMWEKHRLIGIQQQNPFCASRIPPPPPLTTFKW